ncbi:32443_t:CDS:2 [Racocetra persica]|uniref:32443_t:CDS:1 n=1 Tax=Racocetra persica TaxID=160502 RepID=A0ACA9L7S9_9GLOM|nr:32443_t:CDS:2 [Racocetra persica]
MENQVSQKLNEYGGKAQAQINKPFDYYRKQESFYRGLFWIGQNHPSIDKRSYDNLIQDLKRQVQHYQGLYEKRVEKDLDKKDGGTQTDLSDRQKWNLGMLKGKLEGENKKLNKQIEGLTLLANKRKQDLEREKQALIDLAKQKIANKKEAAELLKNLEEK